MENKSQNKAINFFNGPVLVLAGPGCGKTYTLTNRILNLIKNHSIKDENILVVTFTKYAAKEMKERFFNLCIKNNIANYANVQFGTFHSIFFEILRTDYGYNLNSIIKHNEILSIFKEIIENYNIKSKLKNDWANLDFNSLQTISQKFMKFKSKFQNHMNLNKDFSDTEIDDFNLIYDEYKKICFENKKLDYDDMISFVQNYLSNDTKTLSKYQSKYQYILIDEFQDINIPQYEIIKLICASNNIFCVGDDDQSIYNFRGVSPLIMKQFVKDYNNCEIINLNINYRSNKEIINYANNIIKNNKIRFSKQLLPYSNDVGIIDIKSFSNFNEENAQIIQNILQNKKNGLKYDDMAILYRNNYIPLPLIDVLKNNNIPFCVKDNMFNLYDSFFVTDIISYLRIAADEYSNQDFINISNKPLRYITRASMNYDKINIEKIINFYKFTPFMFQTLKKFKKDLKKLSTLPTPLAIHYIRKEISYDNYLIENQKNYVYNISDIFDFLDELENTSIEYPDIKDFLEFYSVYKEYISEINNKDVQNNEEQVKLMTFHSSKGLEFYDVTILDAMDGIIPHKKSIQLDDIESERRLFYVAITRAKQNLHIFFTNLRYDRKQIRSRFIEEGLK